MASGIHEVDLDHADGPSGKVIRSVRVRFGEAHELEVAQANGEVLVRLQYRETVTVLDASRSGCDFERAINLLRLYMPGLRDR